MMMSYRAIGWIIVMCLFLCGGCGLNEGVVQKEPASFLWFTGNTENAVVYIDHLAPINLNETTGVSTDDENSSNGDIHYRISPGKHTIIIKKAGLEIVNRNLLLGNGMTREIYIP